MSQPNEQLELRDRFMRSLYLRMTPTERLAAMARLQASAWQRLRQSP
jgi:hypothetical protein